ncbi:hypothetical protein SO802_010675 [Lithocarpus litseifolius]|uniref:Uncharacterized protein n=1 Tax=Lithocarpus litseifolius TaxID=425828 RepID=A0AAW2DHV1_9ROSI
MPMSEVQKTIFSLYINGVEDDVCGFETHFVYLYCSVLSVLIKTSTLSEDSELGDEEAGSTDKDLVRLTKPERRANLKKQRKEAKKLGRELEKVEEVQQTPQAAVLQKLAELGVALLANPEPNIKSLSYRIWLPTEKELEMKVSKDVKKMFYKSTLLSAYKVLQMMSKVFLWNEKDADGNTVLRHHSNSSKLISQVMNDLRLDKMAFNKQNLDAFDVTLTSEEIGIGKVVEWRKMALEGRLVSNINEADASP